MSLLVVGSVAYDSVSTPRGAREEALGGSATYFCLGAARFTRPSLVAVVGEDFRSEDESFLDSSGVDVSGLERTSGRTFRWEGRYHPDFIGRDTLRTELNVFEGFRPVLAPSHREASLVFLANIQPALQREVLEQVACPRFVAADTMNLWIEGAREELCEVLARVDAIFVNDEEARQLTGLRTVPAAARAIQKLGPEVVVVKRGEHGALLFNDDDVFYVPAFPLEDVVDPTGAGDTFAGGFMGHLARTGDFTPPNLRRAAVVGSLMASFCVEGFSVDRLRSLDLADVRRRYDAFGDLTRFDALSL